jgi:metal-dependent amidase/aminoacylase/carboxypeptidase family protein
MPSAASSLESRIQELLPDLERVYTDIHAHPELSMQETRTAGIAADRLRGAGYDVSDGIGDTGVARSSLLRPCAIVIRLASDMLVAIQRPPA